MTDIDILTAITSSGIYTRRCASERRMFLSLQP